MGLAGRAVHGVAGCGPSFRRRLTASTVLPALCSVASADLAAGVLLGHMRSTMDLQLLH